MNYAPRNNTAPYFQSSRAKSGVSLPIKILGIIIVVLAIFYIFFPRVLPSFFISMVNPLWKAEADARLGTATIEELRDTYKKINEDANKNNSILIENELLKSELGRSIEWKPLLATILKKPPFSAYDSFIIDAGASANVKVGNRVYAIGNIPIGTIAEVMGETSRVKLYSSPGEKFTIHIGPSNIEAQATGEGGGYFEVSLPRDTKIKVGDSVHIPALSDSFVGTVDGIASEPSEPFAKILFHHPVSMYEQRWVIIDTSHVDTETNN